MMKHSSVTRAALKGGSSILLAALAMGHAFAQTAESGDISGIEAAPEGEGIVVTGSRIPRPDIVSNSPVNVVSAEEIKLTATNETEQLLNSLPQAAAGAGAQSNAGNGSATVNLRNLGAVRTLVLQNGRRIVGSSQDGVVDLNMIPPSLIERVEVVTGGASAVYGSDAMAGVVNFVTKTDFEGLEAGGSYGISDEGDAERYNVELTVGGNFADGRGNMVFHGSYYDRAQVKGAARAHASRFLVDAVQNGVGVLVPGGNGVTPQGTIFTPALIGLPDQFGNPIGATGIFFAPEGWRAYRTSDGFNDRPYTNLQMPMKRWQGSVLGHYDLTDDVTAFWEGAYVRSKLNSTLGAVPMSSSGFIPGFQLDLRNPYLAPSLREFLRNNLDTDGNNLVPLNINRRLLDAGDRTNDQTREFSRFVVGLKGGLTSSLNWEVFYNQGNFTLTEEQGGGVLIDNFANSFLTNPADPFDCAVADPRCVTINPFGLNSLTQPMIDYISTDLTNITKISQKQLGGSVTGTLFALPAGNVGISVGAEYRKESSQFTPDQLYIQGKALSRSAGIQATGGSFDVKEAYGELYVPILADMPGVHLLAFEGGVRYSDYSTAGTVISYKAGGEYSPFAALKFRGLYQRAVRAPNVIELFSGATNTAPQATDFCSATASPTATERAFCINSLGIPAAIMNAPGGFQQENTQIRAITGGNPDLQEEVSDTWSVGAVFRPEFIPNLQVTVDYYNIKIEDAIGSFGGGLQAVITACRGNLTMSNIFCQPLANRTPDGQLFDVPLLNANISSLKNAGVDFRVDYRHDVGSLGGLSYFLAGSYLIKSITQGSPIAAPIDCAGYIGGGSCGSANPTWRFTQRLTWDFDAFQLSLRHRFIGSTKDGRIAAAKASGAAAPLLAVPSTGTVHYFDLSAGYDFEDGFSFFGTIDNLTDRNPPYQLFERETYDAIGRRFTLGFRKKF
ncbi:TonB-dependent receptor plug domain-containing protein [Sphingobium boeckii]|uniref:Outer membrane receptor protein involved in Fe transport n=1 Tax=Sphingobium boeckii TaxID=1082345 RepID=A0A7W9AHV5_9SPHN|nr:TonB-dependent receptor [Sphingobium boeckii]MBB5685988.1 outer membrane receptor protein involved in Fe transport [Sphingobium boeckii]